MLLLHTRHLLRSYHAAIADGCEAAVCRRLRTHPTIYMGMPVERTFDVDLCALFCNTSTVTIKFVRVAERG